MSNLSIGMKGPEVGVLQTRLHGLGFYTGAIDSDFGPQTEAAVKHFQQFKGLKDDGVVGPITSAALAAMPDGGNPNPTPVPTPAPTPTPIGGKVPWTEAEFALTAKICGVTVEEVKRAPWMVFMGMHNGMTEAHNDRELADLLWKNTSYAEGQKAHTVSGRAFAWCKATINTAYVSVDVSIAQHLSAAAVDARTMFEPCGYVFGALIPITHTDGSHHVTFFVRWIDKAKHIAACFGGNQGNALKISNYNLSGNKQKHDECIPCPRMPKEYLSAG